MKSLLRWLIGICIMLGTLLLSNCSPYDCRVTFGSSTCTGSGTSSLGGGGGSGSGGGGGGGNNNNATPTAFVYAVDQLGGTTGNGTNGTIDGYDLSASGGSFLALNGYTAPLIPPSDFGQGMVVVNKQFVYALFEVEQELFGWSIDPSTGALTALAGFPMTVSLNLDIVQYNTYEMTTDPAGNFLFFSSPGANDIWVYAINSSTGALTLVTGSPFPSTIEPGNIATDGLGKYLYVCVDSTHEGTAGTPGIEVYSIGANGALTFVGLSGQGMWELQGEASGRYMIGTTGNSLGFGSGRDDDHLYVFSIQQSGASAGALTPVATSPVSTTYSPLTIAMQPASSNGEFLYSFGINDTATGYNPIEAFQLDTTTGALTELSGSPFSNNVFLGEWGQFDQSGSNLLVYSAVETASGVVTQIGPMTVSSTGTLSEPISPATTATAGYWVVTDP